MNVFRLFQRREMPRAQQLGREDDLVFLPDALIEECRSYRDACRLAWEWRRVDGLTKLTLAEEAGLRHNLVTDYFNEDDVDRHGKKRRDLPADKIDAVEVVLGNHAISQYMNRRKGWRILEQIKAITTALAA